MKNLRRPSAIISIIVVIQLILLLAHVGLTLHAQAEIPGAPSIESFNFDPPQQALTIETAVDRGNQVAQSWASNAQLVFASLQVDWPTSAPPRTVTALPSGGWVRLLYVAPTSGGSSDYASLSLLFERVSGQLRDSRVTQWSVTPPAQNLLDGVTVTEEAAILAAEVDGGTAYRAECPAKRNETIVSLTRDAASGTPLWSISYSESGRDSGGSMLISVDASSGQLSVLRENPGACAS